MISALRVLRRSAYLSMYEYFGLYAPKVYLVAWVPRVVLETLFLALVAQFIGGRDLLLFMLVGLAGYRTLHSTVIFTTSSVTGEVYAGTIPLIVGTPTDPVLVLSGRNVAWMAHGLTTGMLTIAVAGVLGLGLTPVSVIAALAVLVVIELSAYALGVLVGSLMLRFPSFGNMTANVVGFALFAVSGVVVPLRVMPEGLQTMATALPLAHGLLALREVFGRADPSVVLALVGMEVIVGIAYFALALLSFRVFLDLARLRGTLDYH